MDINSIRPINSDVVVRYHDFNNVSGSEIIVEDKSKDNRTHYCEVLRISDKVTLVSPGDIVVVSWLNMTEPFVVDIDGKEERVVITTEDHIIGVVEYD